MTKKIGAIVILSLLLSGTGFAQNAIKNAFFLDLGPLLDGLTRGGWGLGAGYERAITPQISLLGHVVYETRSNTYRSSYIDINVHGRYYFINGPAVSGLFAGIGLGGEFVTFAQGSPDETKGGIFDISATVGYKWISDPGFFLEPYLGYTYGVGEYARSNTEVKFGLNLGWAF
jgi:hypothetical protein